MHVLYVMGLFILDALFVWMVLWFAYTQIGRWFR